MGAFCVFGISRVVCRAVATKKTPSYDSKEKRGLTPTEWAARRDALAEQMFAESTRSVRVSPELDAPQFCHDWLAADPSQVRDAVIMVRGPKIDKQGGGSRSQRPAGIYLAAARSGQAAAAVATRIFGGGMRATP